MFGGGRLEIRARCVVRGAGAKRCRQRIVIRVGRRVVARLAVDVRARGVVVRVVTLERKARSRLGHGAARRVALQTCARGSRACTNRGSIAVTKPLLARRPAARVSAAP